MVEKTTKPTDRTALKREAFTLIFEHPERATEAEMRAALARVDYPVLPYLYVLYLSIRGQRPSIGQLRARADALHSLIRGSICSLGTDGRSAILLVSTKQPPAWSAAELRAWYEAVSGLPGATACIGVSSRFEELYKAKTYLRQAEKACRTGRRFTSALPVYRYDDYRIADVIAGVADKTALYSYRYPPLMHLIEYDHAHETSYAYTLYRYLENPEAPREVCRELFIHRNTLYFRLNKAREIMGCDFKTGNEIMQIQFTFLLLDFEGKLERKLRQTKSSV